MWQQKKYLYLNVLVMPLISTVHLISDQKNFILLLKSHVMKKVLHFRRHFRISKPGGFPHLPAWFSMCNGFLTFTSCVTPANLLAASCFHPLTSVKIWWSLSTGSSTGLDCATASQHVTRQADLLGKLELSQAGS